MSRQSEDDRKRLNAEYARIEDAIAEADQVMLAHRENAAQWTAAFEKKADLLKRQDTLERMGGLRRHAGVG